MRKLTPNKNYHLKNIHTGDIYEGTVYLGIHDNPDNYVQVDETEYQEYLKVQQEQHGGNE